jgi:diguanylate cyclase
MDPSRAAPARAPAESAPAQLAKSALRRLVLAKLEPTPENYAQAYRQEAGQAGDEPAPGLRRAIERMAQQLLDEAAAAALAADIEQARYDAVDRTLDAARSADGIALAAMVEQLVRGLERGGKGWTAGRKKESLQRVLAGSRGDSRRLRQRLGQLVASWEGDSGDTAVDTAFDATLDTPAPAGPAFAEAVAPCGEAAWHRIVASLAGTLGEALPAPPAPGAELAGALAEWAGRLDTGGASDAAAAQAERLCNEAERVLAHRHHLLDQLGRLCRELTESLAVLAEDDSWTRGQCEAMRVALDDGLNARGVRAVGDLLRRTRDRQGRLRAEREQAREALKAMIQRMLGELGTLGAATGRFHESMGRYVDTIERADSLESLAGVVREMVEESRTVQSLVENAHAQLQSEHARATDLTDRVRALEGELRRLSDEVATDQLTQIANRRGLLAAFDTERARVARGGGVLAIGLLDIDNFKRLNDELGHAAGDEALRALAHAVRDRLRPTDLVARYGGEEFVVLLPETPRDEAQQILTRLQRALSGALFMHDSKPVFVTFSAGVTDYRDSEAIDAALERADLALYEAKRTGKNRTCVA